VIDDYCCEIEIHEAKLRCSLRFIKFIEENKNDFKNEYLIVDKLNNTLNELKICVKNINKSTSENHRYQNRKRTELYTLCNKAIKVLSNNHDEFILLIDDSTNKVN